MKPFRRELLNGLFVLVVGSLISTAFEAFHVNFDIRLWALIVIGLALAVSGYTVFAVTLGFVASTEEREQRFMAASEEREREWLKRVGTPARLSTDLLTAVIDTLKALSPGSAYTVMFYFNAAGGSPFFVQEDEGDRKRKDLYTLSWELLKNGTLREYKRIICFDHDVLANDPQLKAGILRVGEGPGTIDRLMGEHCRQMLETRNCSLYVAPAVFRAVVSLYGANKAAISIEAASQEAGVRRIAGTLFFSDPPNGEIIEHLREIERATERRMVAVHKIIFPEDDASLASRETR